MVDLWSEFYSIFVFRFLDYLLTTFLYHGPFIEWLHLTVFMPRLNFSKINTLSVLFIQQLYVVANSKSENF